MRDYVLKNIGKNKREVVEECCLQMCREWLEEKKGTGKEERKWRTVLDCVERVYGVERRREIEEELKEKVCVYVCACVRVCVRACVRTCVRACVCVCVS